MISAQKKSFQAPSKLRIATAATAGAASGSMTRRYVLKKPAPSSRAASSKSLGIVRKYCRMKNRFAAEHELDQDIALVGADKVVVDEREARQHLEHGHEPQLVGDHQRREDENEEHLAAGELQARERVAAERAEEDVEEGRSSRRGPKLFAA